MVNVKTEKILRKLSKFLLEINQKKELPEPLQAAIIFKEDKIMIDKIKSEFKLNVKEANFLMKEQDYDAEELIDQNIEDITDLIKGLKNSLTPQVKQNAEGVALSHLIRDLIEDALFVATDSKLNKL